MITSGNVGAAFSQLGFNLNYGDQRKQAQIVADHINKRGGLLGSPVRLVFYDYDAGVSAAVNAQAACSYFTEDHRAFAAIGPAGMDDSYHQCAAKAGMLVISDADLKSASFFRRYPTTVLVSDVELVRKYRGMVRGLHQTGFFGPGAKVGVLGADERNDREGIGQGMLPALKGIGVTPSQVVYVTQGSASEMGAAVSSAVLRFQTEGVTHVVFAWAGGALLFGLQAEPQGYRPKLGIDSRQSPGLLLQSALSPNQLANMYGVGYQPVQDVDAARDPGPVSSNQTLCKKLFDDGGQGWGTNRVAMGVSLYLCDELFFLQQVFPGQPDLTRTSFLNGVAAMGTRHQSTLTFSTRFSSSQHDGAGSWRPLRYERECSCFQYVGPVRPFR